MRKQNSESGLWIQIFHAALIVFANGFLLSLGTRVLHRHYEAVASLGVVEGATLLLAVGAVSYSISACWNKGGQR